MVTGRVRRSRHPAKGDVGDQVKQSRGKPRLKPT
jgi:hypothetical protein